jgi:hypothetical protein
MISCLFPSCLFSFLQMAFLARLYRTPNGRTLPLLCNTMSTFVKPTCIVGVCFHRTRPSNSGRLLTSRNQLFHGRAPFRRTPPTLADFFIFASRAPKPILHRIFGLFLAGIHNTLHLLATSLGASRSGASPTSFGWLPLGSPRHPSYSFTHLVGWALLLPTHPSIQPSIFGEGTHVHHGAPNFIFLRFLQ